MTEQQAMRMALEARLQQVLREDGYLTNGQAWELAEKVAASLEQQPAVEPFCPDPHDPLGINRPQPADEPVACGYDETTGKCETTGNCTQNNCCYTLPQPADERVEWGVEWGKAGEIPCVSIIKRKLNGGIEVLAVEYGTQPADWVGLRWGDIPDEWLGNVAFLEGGKWAEAKLREKNWGKA